MEVTKLPGIDLTIAEQEEEMKMWEDKIKKQKEQLDNLRKLGEKLVGGAGGETDVVMGEAGEK